MKEIFEVEKRIWVIAFFDKHQLTPQQSWRIARRLVWTFVDFQLKIFFRYFSLPALLALFVLAAGIIIGTPLSGSVQDESFSPAFIMTIAVSLSALAGIFIWIFLTSLRLRFLWFIFLDMYGQKDFSVQAVFEKQEKLNEIMKTSTFKHLMTADFGSAVIEVVISSITYEISNIVSMLNGGLGAATRFYGDELSYNASSYANFAATYIIYEESLKATGEPSVINGPVYKLSK
jgi:hypothetical protein